MGPNTFGVYKGYYDDEHEDHLAKIESKAIQPIRKLAQRSLIGDDERELIAEYVAASLYRNSVHIDETLSNVLSSFHLQSPDESSQAERDRLEPEIQRVFKKVTSDPQFIRELRGTSSTNSDFYGQLIERLLRLTWHLVDVADQHTFFLLSDFPFMFENLDDDDKAWLRFPISSKVFLYFNHYPDEKWLCYSLKRQHVVDMSRRLVRVANRYLAAPYQAKWIPNLVRNMKADAKPTYGWDGFHLEPRDQWRPKLLS